MNTFEVRFSVKGGEYFFTQNPLREKLLLSNKFKTLGTCKLKI